MSTYLRGCYHTEEELRYLAQRVVDYLNSGATTDDVEALCGYIADDFEKVRS